MLHSQILLHSEGCSPPDSGMIFTTPSSAERIQEDYAIPSQFAIPKPRQRKTRKCQHPDIHSSDVTIALENLHVHSTINELMRADFLGTGWGRATEITCACILVATKSQPSLLQRYVPKNP